MGRTGRFAVMHEQASTSARFRKGVAAIGLAAAGTLMVACGGSESAPSGEGKATVAGEGSNAGSNASAEIVHGECRDRDDLYMRGTLAVVDESTGGLSEKYMADLENNMFFGDGTADSDSDVDIDPSAYTEDALNQVREGIRQLAAEGSVPGIVYMIGEDDPTQDDFDGKVNANVRGFCVDYN
ncbi:hypothetical protein [Rhodococcus sp. B10]|uniref:hypothetical protein n=1 Tax=Rhodococcus sp. B10 TaxID=2695876 RepID=UPI001431C7CC|nr:hypothetical protein [Rhodococcus sp. B10]NIL77121.1 hypothetical protein [Rhodococcus sp. B10]